MTVFLPDTNVLIDVLNRKSERVRLVRELITQGHSLACCAVTVGEVYAGMRSSEVQITAQLFSTLIWVDVSFPVARKAGELRYEWKSRGVTLAITDTMIAATALYYGMTLITDNRKDFPMPELTLHTLP